MRFTKRLIMSFVVMCIVFLTITVTWGLTSQSAARMIASQLSFLIAPLQIEVSSGTLSTGITVDYFHWKEDSLLIEAENVWLDLRFSCLSSFSVCIKQTRFDLLQFVFYDSGDEGDDSPVVLDDVIAPFFLSIEEGAIKRLQFVTSTHTEKITDVSLSAIWDKGAVQIDHIALDYRGVKTSASGSYGMVDGWQMDLKGHIAASRDAIRNFGLSPILDRSISSDFDISGSGISYEFRLHPSGEFPGQFLGGVDFNQKGYPYRFSMKNHQAWEISDVIRDELETAIGGISPLSKADYRLDHLQVDAFGKLASMSFDTSISLKTPIWPLDKINFNGHLTDEGLQLDAFLIEQQAGTIAGDGYFNYSPVWKGKFNLDVRQLDFARLPTNVPLKLNSKLTLEITQDTPGLSVGLVLAPTEVVYEQHKFSVRGEATIDKGGDDEAWIFNSDFVTQYSGYPEIKVQAQGNYEKSNLWLPDFRLSTTLDDQGTLLQGRVKANWARALEWDLALNAADSKVPLSLIKSIVKRYDDGAYLEQIDKLSVFSLNGDIQASGNSEVLNLKVSKLIGQGKLRNNTDRTGLDSEKDATALNELAFHLDTSLSWHLQDNLQIQQFNFNWLDSTISAKGGIYWRANNTSTPLSFAVENIDLSRFKNDVQGIVSGQGKVSGLIGSPNIETLLAFADLGYQNFSSQWATAKLKVSDLGKQDASIALELGDVKVGDKPIQMATLNLDGKLDTFLLTSKVRLNPDAEMDLACSVASTKEEWQGACDHLNVRHFADTWGIRDALNVTYDQSSQNAVINPVCFSEKPTLTPKKNNRREEASQGASICLSEILTLGQGGMSGQIDAREFPVSWLQKYWPQLNNFKGLLDAEVSFSQSPGEAFTGKLVVDAKRINLLLPAAQAEGSRGNLLPFSDIWFQADVKGDAAQVQSRFDVAEQGIVNLNLTLNDVFGEERVKGILSIEKFDLKTLKAFVPELVDVSGNFDTELAINGTVKDPRLKGSWKVSDGELLTAHLPEPVRNVQLAGLLTDDHMTYRGSLDTSSGVLKLDGDMNWRDKWHLKTKMSSDQITLLPMHGVKLTFVPDLLFDISEGMVVVTGDLMVPSGQIELRELPADAKSVSRDAVVIREKGDEKSEWKVSSDINVSLGDKVYFSGLGLSTLVRGGLRVRQQQDVTFTSGGLVAEEGELAFLGQRLTLDKGRLIFNDTLDNPDLYIEASRKIAEDNVVAGVRLTGKLTSPKLTVFSDPPMEETMALHYLVTGQKLAEGSAYGAGVTLLLDRISGSNGWLSENVVDKLGVTNFQISAQTKEEGASVQLSGYLSPDLYLQYGVKLFSEVNTLSLRYRLKSNLFLEAMTGLDNSLDVIYSFEVK